MNWTSFDQIQCIIILYGNHSHKWCMVECTSHFDVHSMWHFEGMLFDMWSFFLWSQIFQMMHKFWDLDRDTRSDKKFEDGSLLGWSTMANWLGFHVRQPMMPKSLKVSKIEPPIGGSCYGACTFAYGQYEMNLFVWPVGLDLSGRVTSLTWVYMAVE